MDWAGRHGTAWGTVNACLTTIAASCALRFAAGRGAVLTGGQSVLVGISIGVAGILITLLRGALGRSRVHPVTVAYHLTCWTGATVWLASALHQDRWTAGGCAIYLTALAGAAIVAGVLAALAGDGPDGPSPDVAQTQSASSTQRARDAEGRMWEDRIRRVCRLEVAVTGIRVWDNRAPDGRPIGRTIQAEVISDDGSTWRGIDNNREGLEADCDLELGCTIQITRGRTKRIALIDVTEVNVLAQEQLYPADYGPLSVHDPLPMMTSAEGTSTGPSMREHCCGVFGEAGSGKSNTAQVVGVGIARMTDALLVDIDTTGNRLSRDLLHPYVTGQTQQPAVFWAATDAHEAWLLLRALQRAGIARNNNYGDLCRQANDDKVPISHHVPQLLLRADEIAHLCGRNADTVEVVPPEHPRSRQVPTLPELSQSLAFDQRAPGIRAVWFGLRATDDVILQAIQSQTHAVGVLRAADLAEYRWAFGANPPCAPEDAPWAGCIQMRRYSGDPIAPYHVWRIEPNQITEAAIAIDGRKPDLDELTALAMNGRDANGDPFDDLFPGELDCLDTRWDRYFAKYGITSTTTTSTSPSKGTPTMTQPAQQNPSPNPTVTLEQAEADLAEASAALQRRVAEVEAQRQSGDAAESGDGGQTDDGEPVDPQAWERVMGSWEASESATWQDYATNIIRAAGEAGIGVTDIVRALAMHGISVHRDTVYEWINPQIDAGALVKVKRGRYATGSAE